MLQKKYPFLAEMIETPSPSGDELVLQRKWMDYVKDHVDVIESDVIGNVVGIINPEASFKVMLAGHADEIAFMVQHIDSNGFLYVTKAGGINPKVALGARFTILGKNGTVPAIVGLTAEHHGGASKDLNVEDLYFDIGASNKEEAENLVSIGDYVIYQYTYTDLLNNRISGRGLDNRTGSFIVAEVLKRLKEEKVKVGVYGVSTVNEETNMGGAHFAANRIKPTVGIALDVTFSLDQPGSNPKKSGEVALGKGPVLSKGAPIHKILNQQLEAAAKALDMSLQYELTPRRTGTDADAMRTAHEGVPTALVSLPLRYMHSPSEVVSLDDIEAEIQLLVKWISSLSGEESYQLL